MDQAKPSVNIAVCGKFHYHNYIRFVHRQGWLNRFYYAHRRSANSESLGVPGDKLVNVWLKEYLVHAHHRILGGTGARRAFPLYNAIWETGVLRNWTPASLFHLMLHGTGERLLRRARQEGILTLGEPVNSYPDFAERLIAEEHARLGIPAANAQMMGAGRIRREAPLCDYLLCGSEFIRRSYVASGFPRERSFVLPYAADLQYFHPPTEQQRRERDDKFRVLCVGQIVPRKGHVYLLEAWKKCAFPNSELLFIGGLHPQMGPILSRYRGLFTHIPRIPNRELYRSYGNASVFVLMAIEDGFGYVCTEALGCGLPVIVTENTGASDVVQEGKTGYILPIRATEQLAEKLELLYKSPELREVLSQNAARSMTESTSWESYAARLCELYGRLTAPAPAGTAVHPG